MYEIIEFVKDRKKKLPELILFILSFKLSRDNIIKLLTQHNLYTSIYCLFGTNAELKNYQDKLITNYNDIKEEYDDIKKDVNDKDKVYLIHLLDTVKILQTKRNITSDNEPIRVYELKLLEKIFNYKETIIRLFDLLVKDTSYDHELINLKDYKEKSLSWFITIDKILIYTNELRILKEDIPYNYTDISNTELDIRFYIIKYLKNGFKYENIENFKEKFKKELSDNEENALKLYNDAKSQYLLNSIRNITGLDKLQEPYLEYNLEKYLELSFNNTYPELTWDDTTLLFIFIDHLLEGNKLTSIITNLNKIGILTKITDKIVSIIRNIKLTLINLPFRIILIEQMFFSEDTIIKLNHMDTMTDIQEYILLFNDIVESILNEDIDINNLRFINLQKLYTNVTIQDKTDSTTEYDFNDIPDWLSKDKYNIFDYLNKGDIPPFILILLSIKLKTIPILYRDLNLFKINVKGAYPNLLVLDIPEEIYKTKINDGNNLKKTKKNYPFSIFKTSKKLIPNYEMIKSSISKDEMIKKLKDFLLKNGIIKNNEDEYINDSINIYSKNGTKLPRCNLQFVYNGEVIYILKWKTDDKEIPSFKKPINETQIFFKNTLLVIPCDDIISVSILLDTILDKIIGKIEYYYISDFFQYNIDKKEFIIKLYDVKESIIDLLIDEIKGNSHIFLYDELKLRTELKNYLYGEDTNYNYTKIKNILLSNVSSKTCQILKSNRLGTRLCYLFGYSDVQGGGGEKEEIVELERILNNIDKKVEIKKYKKEGIQLSYYTSSLIFRLLMNVKNEQLTQNINEYTKLTCRCKNDFLMELKWNMLDFLYLLPTNKKNVYFLWLSKYKDFIDYLKFESPVTFNKWLDHYLLYEN